MLRELHISNLAVIEDARLELTSGLNVFTGQTGAGKSLVIGAFEALLGLRKNAHLVRTGVDEGRVSGLFEVLQTDTATALTQALDQPVAAGDELLLTRKLHASGRSTVSVNGKPATAAMVREAAEILVDIHGQHDHQHLLKPAQQLGILDAFAKAEPLRSQFAHTWAGLRQHRDAVAALQASATLRQQQLDLYTFQAQEIDAAELIEHGDDVSELEELEARSRVLSSLGRIKQQAGAAHEALAEADGAVVDRLTAIAQVLLDLAQTDTALDTLAEQVRTATLTLQEAGYDLSRYLNRLELDPGELAEIDARLNVLNRLASKYARRDAVPGMDLQDADPITRMLAYRDWIGEEIERFRQAEQDISGSTHRLAELETSLRATGAKLSAKRQAAAKALCPKVEAELAELGMPNARLRVALSPVSDLHDAGPSGMDQVEFEVQTNPGQDFRPLRKIASGGEMSRVMLGLKGILATNDRISVLVFDEVDANIGGRLGNVIGRKLRALARPASPPASKATKRKKGKTSDLPEATQQVLCITHLPQIAAFADRHFHVVKAVEGRGKTRQTVTRVNVLEGAPRVEELAEMMAGTAATDTSRKQAQELLASAH